MSAAENKAVFLSYASQDAAAVRRICDALRAAGIEVWFDQNELTGGDAWDRKIRGQVASCALFLPVISAATQARLEGYFRIEWKLAAQRTHAMADEKTFLLPVVIDGTRDAEAKVPAEFKAVQWTRLPGGETPEKFCARVKALLGGETVAAVADLGPASARPATTRAEGGASPANPKVGRRVPATAWITALVATLAVFVFIAQRRGDSASPPANAGAGTRPPTAEKSAAPAAAWPRDVELRRAMELVNGIEGISEDFALAEEIATKALAKNSTDLEAVTVMARVQVAYIFRGFDRSDERRATAQRYAERAVQLGNNDPEALGALGVFLTHAQGGDFARGRELLERAIALKPGEPFFHRHRDNGLFFDAKIPEAEAIVAAEKTAALFPDDPLAQYELGRHYRDLSRIEGAERAFDRALALAPIANAIVWKARVALWVRGDPSEMKTLLARVPARQRATERVVLSRWTHAMVSGETDDALEGLAGLTGKWVEDFEYNGPKALLIAQLRELQGKRAMARLQYEAALTDVRARQVKAPTDAALRGLEAWVLHGLGRDQEALPLSRVELEATGRPYAYARLGSWWFSILPRCLLLGEKGTALQLIREAVTPVPGPRRLADDPSGSFLTEAPNLTRASLRLRFKLDPRMAPFRDDPEIVALLAEPAADEKKTVAAPVPLSEGAQLAARALASIARVGFTRDDLAVAEDLAKRATDKEPDSATAWGVRAGVQAAWIFRNWDYSETRRQDTQAHANRALSLDRNEPEALLALGHVLRAQGGLE